MFKHSSLNYIIFFIIKEIDEKILFKLYSSSFKLIYIKYYSTVYLIIKFQMVLCNQIFYNAIIYMYVKQI